MSQEKPHGAKEDLVVILEAVKEKMIRSNEISLVEARRFEIPDVEDYSIFGTRADLVRTTYERLVNWLSVPCLVDRFSIASEERSEPTKDLQSSFKKRDEERQLWKYALQTEVREKYGEVAAEKFRDFLEGNKLRNNMIGFPGMAITTLSNFFKTDAREDLVALGKKLVQTYRVGARNATSEKYRLQNVSEKIAAVHEQEDAVLQVLQEIAKFVQENRFG